MVVSKVPVSTWLCHYQHQLGNFRPVTPPSCCCCRCTEEWRIYTIKENEIHRWIHQMCSIEYRHQFIILLNREESQKVSEYLEYLDLTHEDLSHLCLVEFILSISCIKRILSVIITLLLEDFIFAKVSLTVC